MKIYCILLFVLINIFVFTNLNAQKATISGRVFDMNSGEVIPGCIILENSSQKAVQTNEFGFFSLTTSINDLINLEISYLGYESEKLTFKLQNDTTLKIFLTNNNALDEVIVLSKATHNQTNTISLNSKQIRILPTLAGESDLIKILQMTPGVQQGREGSSDVLVRGGSPDQNLILLDNVPLYYVNHLGGFVSVFNPDIVKDVTLLKGGFPANYGGKLSSVIDIKTNEGNYKEFSGSGTIGLLSTKLFLQGPLIKDKVSFIISGRRFMYDLILRPFSKLMFEDFSFGYSFYDFNVKVNCKINPTTSIDFSSYIGNDNLKYIYKDEIFRGKNVLRWGNTAYSLGFKKSINQKVYLKATLANTNYHYSSNENYEDDLIYTSNESRSEINDILLKISTDIFLSHKIFLQTGYEGLYHTFEPGVSSYFSEKSDTTLDNRVYNNFNSNAFENAWFLQAKLKISKSIFADIGLRMNAFQAEDTVFYGIEPRCNFTFKIKQIEIQASYSNMNQYVHLLSGSGIIMPTDFWVPSSKDVVPENSNLLTLGVDRELFSIIDLSTVIYYKTFDHMIEYKEGVSTINGLNDWKTLINKGGTSYSYGLEVLGRFKSEKIESWFSYTYSRTFRKFAEQNSGKEFPYKYDKPHNIILTGIYKFSKKYSFSASWTFSSGLPMTLATNVYDVPENIDDGVINFVEAELYTPKNAFRMKPYHRLDLNIVINKEKKRGFASWNFSIYNVYNRLNPYYYYYGHETLYDQEGHAYSSSYQKLYSMSFFPILPSFSYTRSF